MTEEEKRFFQETLAGVLAEHLRSIAPDPDRHNKEHDFIGALMEREARRAAVQQAIIEKSLAGLVWSAMVGLGLAVWQYLNDHIR